MSDPNHQQAPQHTAAGPFRVGGLCEGYGGISMALGQLFPNAELQWYSELDEDPAHPGKRTAAVRILEHRYPTVPNIGDLTTVDWATLPPIDALAAGWPCQPWSMAGKKRGAQDERAIWPAIAGGIRTLRPGLVFLENVTAIIRAGELERVVTDLAALGYVGAYSSFRASDVGAPHRRARCFIVAAYAGGEAGPGGGGSGPGGPAAERRGGPDDDGGGDAADTSSGRRQGGRGAEPRPERGGEPQGGGEPGGRGDAVADTGDDGRERGAQRDERPQGRIAAPLWHDLGGRASADTDGEGLAGRDAAAGPDEGERAGAARGRPGAAGRDHGADFGKYGPAVERWAAVLGRGAPEPTVAAHRGTGRRISPVLVEWMMGLPAGWVCDVPGLSNADKLRALGNGVVPQQAAEAYRQLLARVAAHPPA